MRPKLTRRPRNAPPNGPRNTPTSPPCRTKNPPCPTWREHFSSHLRLRDKEGRIRSSRLGASPGFARQRDGGRSRPPNGVFGLGVHRRPVLPGSGVSDRFGPFATQTITATANESGPCEPACAGRPIRGGVVARCDVVGRMSGTGVGTRRRRRLRLAAFSRRAGSQVLRWARRARTSANCPLREPLKHFRVQLMLEFIRDGAAWRQWPP